MFSNFPLTESPTNTISPFEDRNFGAMPEQHVCTAETGHAGSYDTDMWYSSCCFPKHGYWFAF